jgi:membrane-associated phospholipid phosphatase
MRRAYRAAGHGQSPRHDLDCLGPSKCVLWAGPVPPVPRSCDSFLSWPILGDSIAPFLRQTQAGQRMRTHSFVDWATQGYLLLVAGLILGFHNATVPAWRWLVAAHLAVVFLIEGLIRWQARQPRCGALSFFRHFYPVLLFAGCYAEIGLTDRMFHPGYLDPVLVRWEQALFGCQPSLEFMRAWPYLGISEVFYASYFSYYLMISGVGIALFLKDRQQFFHYLAVLSFVFYICYLIYLFVPTGGPLPFFQPVQGYVMPEELRQLARSYPFPEAVRAGPFFKLMDWIYHGFELPAAALPSSHVAVALCTVCFSFRYLRPIRWVHLAVAVLLCLATVYCRYHYVLDVIGGVVTAAVLVPLGDWLYFQFPTAPALSHRAGRSCSAEPLPLPGDGAS